jgi:hypothetical protein
MAHCRNPQIRGRDRDTIRGYSELWQPRTDSGGIGPGLSCMSFLDQGSGGGLPVKKGRQLFRGPSGSDLRYLEQTL